MRGPERVGGAGGRTGGVGLRVPAGGAQRGVLRCRSRKASAGSGTALSTAALFLSARRGFGLYEYSDPPRKSCQTSEGRKKKLLKIPLGTSTVTFLPVGKNKGGRSFKLLIFLLNSLPRKISLQVRRGLLVKNRYT